LVVRTERDLMSGGIQPSRKHGPFDPRWPCVRRDSSSGRDTEPLSASEAEEELDWDSFSARHFSERGRHDSEARSAYAAYRAGREWRGTEPASPPRLRLVEGDPTDVETEAEESSTRRLLAAVAELEVETWEAEGGSVSPSTK
jgi:hypothetical protein